MFQSEYDVTYYFRIILIKITSLVNNGTNRLYHLGITQKYQIDGNLY